MRNTRKQPAAIRLRRSLGATSSKVLITLALVFLGLAAYLANVDSDSTARTYFIATRDLAKSTEIEGSTVERMDADLGSSGKRYLLAQDNQLDKWFLVESISSGELIPLSSLAPRREVDCTPIILSLGSALPNTIKAGTSVNLWAAAQSSTLDTIPYEIALSAELISVRETDSGMGDKQQSVEVCVNAAEIRSVVDAIARRSTVVAVRASN